MECPFVGAILLVATENIKCGCRQLRHHQQRTQQLLHCVLCVWASGATPERCFPDPALQADLYKYAAHGL